MTRRGGVTAPRGFHAGTAAAGIKPGTTRDDLAFVFSEFPAVAAGVFTTNRVKAAPVVWSARVAAGRRPVHGVLLNSGNANACTGTDGAQAVRKTVRGLSVLVSELLEAPVGAESFLVCSTGVIGVPFPVERLLVALPRAVAGLAAGPAAAARAARAIMTTDTRPKEAVRRLTIGGRAYTIGGLAKGSGMIHPNMATMLAVLSTDLPLAASQARRLLRGAVSDSFNMITVDGDTSTNDCVLLLANGAAGGRVPPGSRAEVAVAAALNEISLDLARQVAADGEGAGKLMTVTVRGARTTGEARTVARTVASSLLVKTAVHGGDPNWGRVLAAAGRAGVPLDPARLDLAIGGHVVARGGAARPAGESAAARHLRGTRIRMELTVGGGPGTATALGTDLSAAYVAINADYRS